MFKKVTGNTVISTDQAKKMMQEVTAQPMAHKILFSSDSGREVPLEVESKDGTQKFDLYVFKSDPDVNITYKSRSKTIQSTDHLLVAMTVNKTNGTVNFLTEKEADNAFPMVEVGRLTHEGYTIPSNNFATAVGIYFKLHTPGAEADNADGKKAGQRKQAGEHQKR